MNDSESTYDLLERSGENGSGSTDEAFSINLDISNSTDTNTNNNNQDRGLDFSGVMLVMKNPFHHANNRNHAQFRYLNTHTHTKWL